MESAKQCNDIAPKSESFCLRFTANSYKNLANTLKEFEQNETIAKLTYSLLSNIIELSHNAPPSIIHDIEKCRLLMEVSIKHSQSYDHVPAFQFLTELVKVSKAYSDVDLSLIKPANDA